MSDIKQEIYNELERRMSLLEDHLNEEIEPSDNQYTELNRAISKVIGGALKSELESFRSYVESL